MIDLLRGWPTTQVGVSRPEGRAPELKTQGGRSVVWSSDALVPPALRWWDHRRGCVRAPPVDTPGHVQSPPDPSGADQACTVGRRTSRRCGARPHRSTTTRSCRGARPPHGFRLDRPPRPPRPTHARRRALTRGSAAGPRRAGTLPALHLASNSSAGNRMRMRRERITMRTRACTTHRRCGRHAF
jgi:hypothetical protein